MSKINIGSRAQVWHGTASKTSGGLNKGNLMMNKWGRIVSRRMSAAAKKNKRLLRAGYTARKGHFGPIKLEHLHMARSKKSKRRWTTDRWSRSSAKRKTLRLTHHR